jgi:CxxC motif-containing protein (DUF1111 family)
MVERSMQIRLTFTLLGTLAAPFALAAGAGDPALERARLGALVAPANDFSRAEALEALPAGRGTVTDPVTRDIFSAPLANLTPDEQKKFELGRMLFRVIWQPAPDHVLGSSDGLGPLFNSQACELCHDNDGRGRTPAPEVGSSMVLRLAVPPASLEEQALLDSKELLFVPEPTYGGQLQNLAIEGFAPDGRMAISYTDVPVTLAGGEVVTLRAPEYSVTDLAYGNMKHRTMLSARVAPPMIGLGLLEAIPAAAILALADPDDANGDGISGRPNMVRDLETGEIGLGRFGWKAGVPSIRGQSAEAFANDIGVSTPLVDLPHGDCAPVQAACLAAPTGETKRGLGEATAQMLDEIAFYASALGVPQRTNVDDLQVLRGKQQFYAVGCTACHTPKLVTSPDAPTAAHRDQLIWPYTDMLLHDMGEGLADHRPEGDADYFEWRTPPLWGIGLTKTVSGHTEFLHDARARTLVEAILWHGGEGQRSRDAFAAMPKTDRDDLVRFLESL